MRSVVDVSPAPNGIPSVRFSFLFIAVLLLVCIGNHATFSALSRQCHHLVEGKASSWYQAGSKHRGGRNRCVFRSFCRPSSSVKTIDRSIVFFWFGRQRGVPVCFLFFFTRFTSLRRQPVLAGTRSRGCLTGRFFVLLFVIYVPFHPSKGCRLGTDMPQLFDKMVEICNPRPPGKIFGMRKFSE